MIRGTTDENIHRTIAIFLGAVFLLLLTACQGNVRSQAPAAQVEPEAPPSQMEEPIAETPEVIETAPLVCPEPEPVPAVECPPPPKPKPCPVCPTRTADDKMILGEVEKITIDPPGVTYTARIDTGAGGTSIHATNIVRFERDGENWVRFELENPKGEPFVLEREIVRKVRVRQVELDEFERRLKVMLTMKIGTHTELVEFSLNDRSEMEHPILIGRNFLRNIAIVDVSQEFIAK